MCILSCLSTSTVLYSTELYSVFEHYITLKELNIGALLPIRILILLVIKYLCATLVQ